MQISETGYPRNNSRSVGGFTLIEILVVVLIIGIMALGVVLSLGLGGKDTQLEQERDRMLTITGYLREQAALQNREYGMRCFDGGYEFLTLDMRRGLWSRVENDPLLRTRRLPEGLLLDLVVEGRRVLLPKPKEEERPEEVKPQVILFASGDLSDFEITLRREDGAGSDGLPVEGPRVRISPDKKTGDIVAEDVVPT
jgi:general secretion pathway protein H